MFMILSIAKRINPDKEKSLGVCYSKAFNYASSCFTHIHLQSTYAELYYPRI
jgi:hypothetical protein